MGWDEWPLFVFTVIAQTAIGAFWWCCIALFAVGDCAGSGRARGKPDVGDLGNARACVLRRRLPPRQAAAVRQRKLPFGRAHFLNEVVFGSVFVGLGVLGWLMGTFGVGSPTVQLAVHALTILVSFAFLTSMTAFYLMPTAPTWNTR